MAVHTNPGKLAEEEGCACNIGCIKMMKDIKIPRPRLPILIGVRGKTKCDIEKSTKTKIEINDEVIISGEAVDVMIAENVVKAIGRGFSPENALYLVDENFILVVIPLPKDRKRLIRVKSRIIGTNGRARKCIERLTDTVISVYGKTVSIIGKYENTEKAKEAIERLLNGAPHKLVYAFLEGREE